MSATFGRWFACCLVISSYCSTAAAARKPRDAVLLSTVKSLTFHNGRLTTGRRLEPMPQMTCVGGSAQKHYSPDTIRCVNAGSSYASEDIDWTCTASLPVEFKLGSTEVVCEGYESAEDDYVLKGSCALEYRLILTDAGEAKYAHSRNSMFGLGGFPSERLSSRVDQSSLVPSLFWLVFVGVVVWMIYSAFFRNRTTGNIPTGWGGWGGGGGGGNGGGGNDDPPPPYSPASGKSNTSPYTGRQNPGFARAPPQQGQAWRPGFWTGAAAGAAGGWLAGRGGSQRQQASPMQQRQSTWFGGDTDPGRGSSTRIAADSTPSFSSQRHTSTGFGGTRRR